jgi:hypothetical protein
LAGGGQFMVTLAMICLAGMALGQRFKVFVLVPAIALTLVFTIGAGIAGADAALSIGLMTAAAATSLQVGYLAGSGIRQFLMARAITHKSSAATSRSAP